MPENIRDTLLKWWPIVVTLVAGFVSFITVLLSVSTMGAVLYYRFNALEIQNKENYKEINSKLDGLSSNATLDRSSLQIMDLKLKHTEKEIEEIKKNLKL